MAILDYILLCLLLKFNQSQTFLYYLFILLRLIFSFVYIRSLLVSYAYVSIESVDCILLLSFELTVILLISSVKYYFIHF